MLLFLFIENNQFFVCKLLRKSLFAIVIFINAFKLKAQVNADFTANTTRGCSPLIVQFINTSTGNPNSFFWNFGNGATSDLQNPSSVYVTPGTYTVSLTVSNGTSTDTETKTFYITVFQNPVARFSSPDSAGCVPFTAYFNDISLPGNAPINSWIWDFGDGTYSNQQNTQHIYNTVGSYNVSLIIRDTNGCTDNRLIRNYINVTHKPYPSFYPASSVYSCQIPFTVQFTDNTPASNTQPYAYLWDFGDGNYSTLQNPQHTYNNYGIYNVSLTITDAYGCTETFTRDQLIRITNYQVNFTANNINGCDPTLVTFTNTSNVLNSNNIITWNFGDGQQLTVNGADQHAIQVTHNYSTGTYFPSLTYFSLTDSCTFNYSLPVPITIVESPVSGFYSDFSPACSVPQTVQFTDTSHRATEWLWDFGDGSFSALQNPQHIYTQFGMYTVRLITRNHLGCTDTLSIPYYISYQPPSVDFNAFPTGGCIPFDVLFTDLSHSNDSIISWFWDLGDGTNSTLQNPVHTYTNVGIYDVSLTINTANGCTNTLSRSQYIFAGERPHAAFYTPNDTVGCINDMNITFINQSSLPSDTYIWDFGDGTVIVTNDTGRVTHNYDTEPDEYTVTLIAINSGCVDTMVRVNYIKILSPYASFIADVAFCTNDSVRFTDLSRNASEITSWHWNFGTGNPADTSNLRNPVFLFPFYGSFMVELNVSANHYVYDNSQNPPIVVDTITCTDDFVRRINIINYSDTGSIFLDDSIGCAPFPVNFTNTTLRAVSWLWNFGDGTTETTQNPQHTYQQPGIYYVSCRIITAQNCTILFDSLLKVMVQGPVSGYIVSPVNACIPQTATFTDTSYSDSPIISKEWDFGNGVILNSLSNIVQYTYQNPFPYPAYIPAHGIRTRLTITDSVGCTSTSSRTIYYTKPKPDFSIQQYHLCTKDSFIFRAIRHDSTGLQPFRYFWKFGDGTVSTAYGAPKTYPPGTYNVTLYLYDANNCVDSITKTITVSYNRPIANFTAYPTHLTCPPIQVFFNDSSQAGLGNITSWKWDFGDGTYSNLQNPAKTYIVPGVYSVKLTITDAANCKDSLFVPNLIRLDGPTGYFTMSDSNGCIPLSITLSAHSPNAATFLWDLRDGNVVLGRQILHTYNLTGTFAPILILTDSGGCVRSLPPVDTITVYPNPQARFSYNNELYCQLRPVHFYNQSINTYPLNQWVWNFGDGSIDNTENPTHLYQQPGNYNVSLRVIDINGCYDDTTTQSSIQILESPIADFNFDTLCTNERVHFYNLSQTVNSPIVVRYWDLGNGTTSTFDNPTTVYTQQGSYVATLIVINSNNCSDTLIKNVEVYPKPVSSFNVADACVNQLVNFSNTSTIDPSIYNSHIIESLWDFGDNTISSLTNPTHLYNAYNRYRVSLISVSNYGCKDTFSLYQNIYPIAIPQFSSHNHCLFDTIMFVEMSVLSDTIFHSNISSWQWNFGDGSTSYVRNPSHYYLSPGVYLASLIVNTNYQCVSSITDTVYIFPKPLAQFNYNETCVGQDYFFHNVSSIYDSLFHSSIIRFYWYQNGQFIDSAENPAYRFNHHGLFPVSLVVYTDNACSDTVTHNVRVFPLPVAHFTVNNACIGEIALFSNNSYMSDTAFNSTISNYYWDLGDGTTSTEQNPSHVYSQFGNYNTSLIVQSNNNCYDTMYTNLVVYPKPIPSFTFNEVCLGNLTLFNNTSTIDTGIIQSYIWLFDDGTQSNDMNPQHLYNSDGTYQVRLIAVSSNHCVDTIINSVTVFPLPQIHFFAIPWEGCVPLTVRFIDSSYINSGEIVNWIWNFGTGDTSHMQNPTYTYSQVGTYTIHVIAISDKQCESNITMNDLIKVFAIPNADFTVSPEHLNPFYSTVWLTDRSSSDVVRWYWDFGDSIYSTLQNPQHTYMYSDTFIIKLIVMNGNYCYDTAYMPIIVDPDYALYIPNAFTPNGDNFNDEFFPKGFGIKEFTIYIYNKWGELLFTSDNMNYGWNGTYKGEECPQDTYVYKIVAVNVFDEKKVYIGKVTLIR